MGVIRPNPNVQTIDGATNITNVKTIKVTNGDLSGSNRVATIDTSGDGGTAALTATYVGYGSGSNLLTGESTFTYNATTNQLQITTAGTDTDPELILKRNISQYLTLSGNYTSGGGRLQMNSASNNAKNLVFECLTDASPTGGGMGFDFLLNDTVTSINVLKIDHDPGQANGVWTINDSADDINFKVKGTSDNLFVTDGAQNLCSIGDSPSSRGKLFIKQDSQFDPTTSTAASQYATLSLYGGGTADNGAYGAAIAFSGIGSTRRRAAIAAVQSSADADEVGIAFLTSDGTTSADETLSEHMRLDDNGRLYIKSDAVGTATAEARLHVVEEGTTPAAIFQCAGTGTNVKLISDDTGSQSGPDLTLTRTAIGADDDYLGEISWEGRSDTDATREYARITARISDASNTSEDGACYWYIMKQGTLRRALSFTAGGFYVNNDGYDINFGVNDATDVQILGTDAGQSRVSLVKNTIAKTDNFTIDEADCYFGITFTMEATSNKIFTLPAAVKGMSLRIVNIDAAGGSATTQISANGSDEMNGSTSNITLSSAWQMAELNAYADNKWVVSFPAVPS